MSDDSSAPLSSGEPLASQIDRLCDRFESAWLAGRSPGIEHVLSEIPETTRDEFLRELLVSELRLRAQDGESPTVEEYSRRFPDHGPLVASVFGEEVGTMAVPIPRSGSATWRLGGESSLDPDEGEARSLEGGSRYVLKSVLAEGGMGRVYRAFDNEVRREVAIKILHRSHCDGGDLERRFLDEARVTGQLQHPGIPPIHDIGRLGDGRPYFSMKLIEGDTLGSLLLKSDVGHSRTLDVFAKICEIVGYAHGRGVIHRDLKPANIMVGEFGEVQVMDWGLAKTLGDGATSEADAADAHEPEREATRIGDVVGTPAYMPPEQARGEPDIDRRSDVFGLGAILTTILTGSPPFLGQNSGNVIAQSANGDVGGAIERLRANGADEELVRVAERCLSVEREARPADANEVLEAVEAYRHRLAEDKRRAEQEDVRASTVRGERHRRRLVVVGAFTVLVVAGVIAYFVVRHFRREGEKQTHIARREAKRRRQLAYNKLLLQVQAHWERDALDEAEALLPDAESSLRGIEWTYWDRRLRGVVPVEDSATRSDPATADMPTLLAYRPAGTQIASGCATSIDIRDSKTGKIVRTIGGLGNTVLGLDYSPDGRRLVGCTRDIEVLVWESDTGKEVARFRPFPDVEYGRMSWHSLDVSGDGKLVALAANVFDEQRKEYVGEVHVLDSTTGEVVRMLKGDGSTVWAAAFSPDGRRLAAQNAKGKVRLWETATWQVVGGVSCDSESIECLGFDSTGERLAGGSRSGKLFLWDLGEGRGRSLVAHSGGVTAVAFHPSRPLIYTSGKNARGGESACWHIDTGRARWRMRGATRQTFAIRVRNDGEHVATAGQGGHVRIWDALAGHGPQAFGVARHLEGELSFSRDGGFLACCSRGVGDLPKAVFVVNVETGAMVFENPAHSARLKCVALSSDGRLLASGDYSGEVQVWDWKNSSRVRTLRRSGEIDGLLFDARGRSLLVSTKGELTLVDVATGATVRWLGSLGDSHAEHLESSRDGRLVVGHGHNRLAVWDWRTGKVVFSPADLGGAMLDSTIAPDGGRVAASFMDGSLAIWDVGGGKRTHTLRGHTKPATGVMFDSTGSRLVSSSQDGTVRVWELSSSEEVLRIQTPGMWVESLAIDRRTRRVAATASLVWTAAKPRRGEPDPILLWRLSGR